MILKDPIWFAPHNVIHHFVQLKSILPPEKQKSKNFRKAEEMNFVAVMLVGLQVLQHRKYWLQMVDDSEGSPDVRTGTFIPPSRTLADDFCYQDVEVVTYGKYSKNEFLDFLKNTKLSPQKSYDSKTLILCVIRRNAFVPPLEECRQNIEKMSINCSIMIIGQLSNSEDRYKIAQIYPKVELETEFILSKTLKENSHTGVKRLEWHSKPKSEYHPEDKHFPFEKLNF